MLRPWSLRPYAWSLAALYLAAWVARYPLTGVRVYGDEGGFYYIASHGWAFPSNVSDVYGPLSYYPATQFLWERPLFYALLAPSAHVSFEAMRWFHVTLTSLLAPLATDLLRRRGLRIPIAFGAGIVAAFHPVIITWTSLVLADGLMTLALLVALWFFQRGPWQASMVARVAAVWIKEVAILGVAALAVWELGRWWRSRRPAEGLGPREWAAALVVPVALVPFLVSKALGLPGPGTPASEAYSLRLLEQLTLTAWILPLALVGLLLPKNRAWAAAALFYPAVLWGLHAILGRSVEVWYIVPANVSILLGAAFGLDAAWSWARSSSARKAVPALASVLVVSVILAHGTLENTPAKGWFVHPTAGLRENNVWETYAYESTRDPDLWDAIAFLNLTPGRTAFTVDVYGSYVMHPISTSGATIRTGDTFRDGPAGAWASAVETSNVTLLQRVDRPLNAALRETYEDCRAFNQGRFEAFFGQACAGRAARLEAALAGAA